MQGSWMREGGLMQTSSLQPPHPHRPTDRPTDQPPDRQALTPISTYPTDLPHQPNCLTAKQIAKTFGLSGWFAGGSGCGIGFGLRVVSSIFYYNPQAI